MIVVFSQKVDNLKPSQKRNKNPLKMMNQNPSKN